ALKADKHRWPITAIFVLGGLVAVFGLVGLDSGARDGSGLSVVTDMFRLAVYYVQLFGGVANTSDPDLMVLTGCLFLVCLVILAFSAYKAKEPLAFRVGMVLIFGSLLNVAGFASGRYSY